MGSMLGGGEGGGGAGEGSEDGDLHHLFCWINFGRKE
jgi:hypothetical protein